MGLTQMVPTFTHLRGEADLVPRGDRRQVLIGPQRVFVTGKEKKVENK
jgi:hypothetical protein